MGKVTNRTYDTKTPSTKYTLIINALKENGNKVEHDVKYESEQLLVELTDEDFKRGYYDVPTVTLNLKRVANLEGMTVTASKVMFYHKGDTLVYNADAFVLAEGSMLDALLNQMPGVRMNEKGEIFCNGRKIDNLLINGKDVFNGQMQLMLDNLPAYTVKDVAVYDKRGRMSELMHLNAGDTKHVMDVRLKRKYSQGFMLNAEAGYGAQGIDIWENYLARGSQTMFQ